MESLQHDRGEAMKVTRIFLNVDIEQHGRSPAGLHLSFYICAFVTYVHSLHMSTRHIWVLVTFVHLKLLVTFVHLLHLCT